jgi:hypothetical protein
VHAVTGPSLLGRVRTARFLQNRGVAAEQVPLSGAAGGKFAGDISIPIIGRDLIAEVKVRGEGFRQVYGWLAGNDLLIIRVGLSEPQASNNRDRQVS